MAYVKQNFQPGAVLKASEMNHIEDGIEAIEEQVANKLDASELPTAIDIALLQAKNSGEFDGTDGKDGQNGSNGTNGADGFSPTVSVAAIDGGHKITITDKNGTKTVDVMDGTDGQDGAKGADGEDGANGTSVTHSWNGTTLTITSASGTSSADLKGDKGATGAQGIQGIQGEKGETGAQGAKGDKGDKGDTGDTGAAGKDGVSATHSWNGTFLTVSSASGTSSANLRGSDGYGVFYSNDSVSVNPDGEYEIGTGTVLTDRDIQTGDFIITEDGNLYRVSGQSGGNYLSTTKVVLKGSDGAKGDKGDTGPAYTLTSADKTAIANQVKESLVSETWTFTLDSGSTVTKAVYVG